MRSLPLESDALPTLCPSHVECLNVPSDSAYRQSTARCFLYGKNFAGVLTITLTTKEKARMDNDGSRHTIPFTKVVAGRLYIEFKNVHLI